MKKINIKGVPCSLKAGHYNNQTMALQAITEEGEPMMVITVNGEDIWDHPEPELYKEWFKPPVIVVKNYSENEGVVQDLIDAGVATDGPYLSVTNQRIRGKVHVMRLTEAAMIMLKSAMILIMIMCGTVNAQQYSFPQPGLGHLQPKNPEFQLPQLKSVSFGFDVPSLPKGFDIPNPEPSALPNRLPSASRNKIVVIYETPTYMNITIQGPKPQNIHLYRYGSDMDLLKMSP